MVLFFLGVLFGFDWVAAENSAARMIPAAQPLQPERRPALLMVASTLDAADGGVARSTPLLAEAVAASGIAVRLVGRVFSGPSTIKEGGGRLTVRLVPGRGRGLARMLPDVRFNRALGEELAAVTFCGLPVVHHPGVWTATNLAAVRAARVQGSPVVCSPRGMLDAWSLGFSPWRKRIAWRLYARRVLMASQLFHATSYVEAEAIRALGFRQPIAVVPNGVVMPPHACAGRDRGPAKRMLFLSRIHPKKGLPNLLAAWAQVRPAGWELVIAGPDELGHQAKLLGLVAELGISSAVRFVGEVGDEAKWALYRSADLFVLPTHTENFGMVVPEALACGVPVITTTGAPWAELMERHCGWWVKPNALALEAALRAAFAVSEEERGAMGVRGRKLVEERYQWPAIGMRMAAVYQWMVGGRPPPVDVTWH